MTRIDGWTLEEEKTLAQGLLTRQRVKIIASKLPYRSIYAINAKIRRVKGTEWVGVYLSKEQTQWINKKIERLGISKSEILRKLVEKAMETESCHFTLR